MKVFVCLFALVACASASPALSTGTSTSSRTQDSAGNYAFAYNEQHSTGGSSRQESGNGWQSVGSYSLNVGDGRQRIVKYIADGAGFRAAIATNEPGTANQPAAATAISSPYLPPQPVQPIAVAAVPVAEPASIVQAPIEIPQIIQQVAEPAPIALIAPASIPALPTLSLPAPIVVKSIPTIKAIPAISSYSTSINHIAPAPAPVQHVLSVAEPAPIAIKSVPTVSSYSTSINHVSPISIKSVAPLASQLTIPAIPTLVAAQEPIVQAPLALSGWN